MRKRGLSGRSCPFLYWSGMRTLNVFEVVEVLQCYGGWYTLWRYGFRNLWTIFIAWRMAVRDNKSRLWINS